MESEDLVKTSIQSQISDCDKLIHCAKLLASEDCDSSNFGELFKNTAILLTAIKGRNRSIYLSVESKRKDVEREQSKVDRLNLDLENLKYKQAYLQREIRECKDLSTPSLGAIEKELNSRIGLSAFVPTIDDIHTEALACLNNESDARKELQTVLLQLNLKSQIVADRLDKKRKFLDELPTRVSLVKAATNDLQSQFQQYCPTTTASASTSATSASTSPSMPTSVPISVSASSSD